MTTNRSIHFMLVLAVGLGWSATGAAQHDHGSHDQADEPAAHEHDSHTPPLELDGGQRWQTDASLREGMQRIRRALDTAQAGQPGPDATAGSTLAAAIDDAVAYMVTNCRLSPKADANLHVVLGRLGQASATLKQNPAAPQAVEEVAAALDLYGQYFDHPGWEPIHDGH
jgi:hypothetical protein